MMTDKVKRKHNFQIRKVPLKRFIPQKTPELYALDVHSICLPNKNKKNINWVHCDVSQNYEDEFNDQIIYSQAYQQLYSKYLILKQERLKQKNDIQNDIDSTDKGIQKQHDQKKRLLGIRDGLYTEIQELRDELTQVRDKNYNLRWEIYHQRGPNYANMNGFSFLQPNQMTYEELLQMQDEMGNVSKGMLSEQIDKLSKKSYKHTHGSTEICCICYEQMVPGQKVIVFTCRHIHHVQCIKDWLLKQKICPICKQEITITYNNNV